MAVRIREVMERIVRSPVYRSEVDASLQLGLPGFTLRGRELFAAFEPHRERVTAAGIEYSPALYRLELVYPFRHIIVFQNRTYDEPTLRLPAQTASVVPIAAFPDLIKRTCALLESADALLSLWEVDPAAAQSRVLKYQQQFQQITEALGLQGVYGGIHDSNSSL